ncbi:MAG: AAA family ATPase [Ignavibacteriae bacterium]|nr:AAA family ATPase [Ignavibacteriota bacterium]
MFNRIIIKELENWAFRKNRKPLILRGARQVGKTTLIKQFSEQFDEFIYLNLETEEDKNLFNKPNNVKKIIEAVFYIKNKKFIKNSKTLIFIDEIQESPRAMEMLRYFYEEIPELFVIAAGSLLESVFNFKINYPVGRVEYLVLRPVSFTEFLGAMNEHTALEQLEKIPLENFAYNKIMKLFHTYTLIGGMPEIVKYYSENKELTGLKYIYESLITSYLNDVEKYAKNSTRAAILRHVVKSCFSEAGRRIKFQGFGNSNYKSREIGEALKTLEKTLLINLIYPVTSQTLPLIPNKKKSPRLQILDTGLLNYFVGIQHDIIQSEDLNSIYKGTMIEHLTGQELLSSQYNALSSLHFWVREKNTSSAEIDFLYQYHNKLIPVEVKSGKTGTLKSLHLFMDTVPHNIAIRLYSGDFNISEAETQSGKKFKLINLPYFLTSQIENYIRLSENE